MLNDDNMLNIKPIKEIINIRGHSNNVTKGGELQIILSCNTTSTHITQDRHKSKS